MSSATERDLISIPPSFALEDDLLTAWQLMEFSTDCIFLTGRAGTGKSTLLNYFRKTTAKKYVVLAPTGLAALQVGGSTIHSFFGFPLRKILRHDPEIKAWGKNHPRRKILLNMDSLIIDEVSMVRSDLLNAVDWSLRLNMGNDLPFGGKQIIFIGDVFQLSPVVTSHDFFSDDNEEYEIPYFFGAYSFRSCRPRVVELKKIYRQHDHDFIYLLNKIRTGLANHDDLDELNKRVEDGKQDETLAITLTSVNASADLVNLQKLVALKSPLFQYRGKVEGQFYEKHFPAPLLIGLKEGAQVMLVRNDLQGRWVNGSIGTLEELSKEKIKVRFADGKVHSVEPVTWENKIYRWDASTQSISFEVLGTFTQYPIKLSWAVTIHKSQGLTFDKVIIDMGKGAFAHGQLYVALSRCRSLSGITLKKPLTQNDIIVDEEVEAFAGRWKIG